MNATPYVDIKTTVSKADLWPLSQSIHASLEFYTATNWDFFSTGIKIYFDHLQKQNKKKLQKQVGKNVCCIPGVEHTNIHFQGPV